MNNIKNIIKHNCFYDSIFLMQLSSTLSKTLSSNIVLMMGTDANKSLLKEQNLLTSDGEKATVNDLIICCDRSIDDNKLFSLIDKLSKSSTDSQTTPAIYEKQETQILPPGTNLVLISIPGEFVYYETKKIIETFSFSGNKILNHTLCLFIFSDNVTIDEELKLKTLALKHNILILGPDCGTAIINGIGLGFANNVRTIFELTPHQRRRVKGIGIISAGGTGLQTISSMIHNLGYTITQAIGTGGRDLSDKIGGITTLEAIKILENDPETKVIIIFSKPPSKKVASKILNYIRNNCKKKFIINFLGIEKKSHSQKIVFTKTTDDAVITAIKSLDKKFSFPNRRISPGEMKRYISILSHSGRKYVRGLYSGGSLCDEAMIVLKDYVKEIYSNVPLNKKYLLPDPWKSVKHTIIDLGDDIFTRGKPHPMIDFTFRKERILQEAQDKNVAVIMFDLVLGYGAHPTPVKELSSVIRQAKKVSNNEIIFCSVIVGTNRDPQNYNGVVKSLKSLGVVTFSSNVEMSLFVGKIIAKLQQ